MSIELTMPRLSDTMESGTILKWNVKEGDSVSAGSVVADVETDKATMEMQAFDDGVLARIIVGEGQSVPVGTTIALIAEDNEDPKAVAAASVAAKPTETAASTKAESPATTSRQADAPVAPSAPAAPAQATAPPDGDGGARLRVSPVARRLADQHGLDVNGIRGSGPNGRVVKDDVLAALEKGDEAPASEPGGAPAPASAGAAPLAPAATALESRVAPLSSMRQTIARRLVESKTTVPHYQVTMRFDMEPLLALRTTLNEQLAAQGVKLSVNDFLLRGCALAMHTNPEFNASWAGAEGVRFHGRVNVGMAISLPRERGGGLVVGVVRDADRKGLRQISDESKALAERARGRGLSAEDMADSTFTISNLGMFGVEHFTAIINPPNSAILAVGAALEAPVVRDGKVVVGHEMQATLSLDHRVIDGAMAATYLQTLKRLIEHPAALLV